MRKIATIVVTLIILSTVSHLSFAKKGDSDSGSSKTFIIRPLLGIGITSVANSVSETYNAATSPNIDRNVLNYRFALQLLKEVGKGIRIGGEFHYAHILKEFYSVGGHPFATYGGSYFNINYFSIGIVIETKLIWWLTLQTSFGLASASGTDGDWSVPYVSLTPGIEIPVGSSIAIPILLRIEALGFNNTFTSGRANGGLQSIMPITLMAGVSIKL